MGKGSGYGKTILIGDQFVLYGVPAIVSAISYQTEAVVERTEGRDWILTDNRHEVPGYKKSKADQQVESINRILKVMKVDTDRNPIRITLGGNLLAGSGVGASAASCVSLARALNDEFNLGYSIEQINQVGWEGEFAYHGTPSGVDNTASCFGGLILFQLQGDRKIVDQIAVREPIRVVLGNSGVSANTAALDGLVEALKEKDPEKHASRLKHISEQVFEVKAALLGNDLEKVGSIITENHKVLIDMGLSHEKLIYLCDRARKEGALGAKLTGGGMGGFMLALTPDAELQNSVAAAIESEGFYVIKAQIGG